MYLKESIREELVSKLSIDIEHFQRSHRTNYVCLSVYSHKFTVLFCIYVHQNLASNTIKLDRYTSTLSESAN